MQIQNQKEGQKVTGKLGECIFSHENTKSFWGPKVGPRPHTYISFAHTTLLHCVGKIGPTRVGSPLTKSWLCY